MMKVAFTFDDATKGHITCVAPILEKYGYRGLFIESRKVIEREIGVPVRCFCFPHNAANRAMVKIVRNVGMIPVKCSRPNFWGTGYLWTKTSPGAWIGDQVSRGEH